MYFFILHNFQNVIQFPIYIFEIRNNSISVMLDHKRLNGYKNMKIKQTFFNDPFIIL